VQRRQVAAHRPAGPIPGRGPQQKQAKNWRTRDSVSRIPPLTLTPSVRRYLLLHVSKPDFERMFKMAKAPRMALPRHAAFAFRRSRPEPTGARCKGDAGSASPLAVPSLARRVGRRVRGRSPLRPRLRGVHAPIARHQSSANCRFFKSVTSMAPGACVIANGGLTLAIIDWGVTPQAQKTGSSSALISTASP